VSCIVVAGIFGGVVWIALWGAAATLAILAWGMGDEACWIPDYCELTDIVLNWGLQGMYAFLALVAFIAGPVACAGIVGSQLKDEE